MLPVLATLDQRVYYEWARVVAMDQWWHWLVLVGTIAGLGWLVVQVYRRDATELPRGIGGMALTFRVVALVLLLVYFLDLQKRTETRVVRNSRAVVMVDTSQSMSLRRTVGDDDHDADRGCQRTDGRADRLPPATA